MGLPYGISFVGTVLAWDTSANAFKTGDSANISTSWVKDGTRSATTNANAETDATNCPGEYKVTLTATEAQCLTGTLCGKSTTANIVIIPLTYTFVRLPNVDAGASTGLLISGPNAGTTTLAALTVTGSTTLSDGLLVSRSSANTSAITATGNGTGSGFVATSGSGATGDGIKAVAASTNGNGLTAAKTGSGNDLNATSTPLTLAKTTNITGFNDIAASAIVSSGAITTSGGAVSTVTTVTNQLTAAQVATGVWQDTTAGDFTVASSIGKSLYTTGNAPGAASGLALVGSNMGTVSSVTGAVGSVTGAVGSVTGNVGGNVVGSVASVTAGVTVTTNNDKTGYRLDATGSAALTESYAADGAAATLPQLLYMTLAMLSEFSIVGTTLTAKHLDGTTTAGTFTLNDATTPTSITRAT